jgi:hypothetical protein
MQGYCLIYNLRFTYDWRQDLKMLLSCTLFVDKGNNDYKT